MVAPVFVGFIAIGEAEDRKIFVSAPRRQLSFWSQFALTGQVLAGIQGQIALASASYIDTVLQNRTTQVIRCFIPDCVV